jgi:hypothetical protein
MKTVAIVAPQFAPCSYPPAIRVRFFTNHMKQFGWHPIVLTVEPQYMEEPRDWEFSRMIPDDLDMVRVRALPPKWTRKLGVGDLGIRCFPYMVRELRQLCRQRHIDALFIPGPPWHTFMVGPKIKREFGIPYVIDYIDPWVSSWGDGEPIWKKAFWYRQMAILLEPFAVRHVDHVTAVSEGTNNGVRSRYPFMPSDMFTAIPYGGEPADFEYLKNNPRPNSYWDKDESNFHVCYVGAMLPKAYDTLRALFSALIQIREQNPALYSRFRFHFIGTTYDPDPKRGLVMPVAKEMGLEGIVTEHPKRIPYLEAMNVLCQSDALVAMGTSERHYTASKIFPCILAKRPLLAIYHEDSSVVAIMRKAKVGELVTYSDRGPVLTKISEIREKLTDIAMNPDGGPALDLSHFEDLTARKMTSKLACILEQITPKETQKLSSFLMNNVG